MTTDPHLAPSLKKSSAITLLHLWTFMACYMVKFTFTLTTAYRLQVASQISEDRRLEYQLIVRRFVVLER
jgi:hypothetical protein